MKIRGHEIIHGTLEIMAPHCAKNAIFYYIKITEPRRWKFEENHSFWEKVVY